MGVFLLEGGDPFGEKMGAAAFHGGDVEHTLQTLPDFPDLLGGFIDQVENLVRVLEKQFPLLGQGDAVGTSKEQLRVQLLFQILNLAAQGRLGDIQLLRCPGKVFFICDCLKISNVSQLHDGLLHYTF